MISEYLVSDPVVTLYFPCLMCTVQCLVPWWTPNTALLPIGVAPHKVTQVLSSAVSLEISPSLPVDVQLPPTPETSHQVPVAVHFRCARKEVQTVLQKHLAKMNRFI